MSQARFNKEIKIFGTAEEAVIEQMQSAMEKSHADYGVLCADNHLGYSIPVGGVIAFADSICPNGVGYDIACGNKAVRLDSNAKIIRKGISQNMDAIQSTISFGVGRKNNEKVDHPIFDEPIWEEIALLKSLKDKARSQLGTVGSGNHYVDIFVDEQERIWVGVHFGSRGLGHAIATYFINAGGGKDGVHEDPVLFKQNSELGALYIRCMELAGRYAYAGRDWVSERVAKILKGNILEEMHNHHNFAWKERHFNRDLWVIRKGSTPAFAGQRGFVGGSMGDISVILEGVESETSRAALYSTIHGAGRVMGRMQAKGKRDKRGNVIRPGLIGRDEMFSWVQAAGVELRGADVDEAPQAYKRIEEVLKAHQDTIKILHILKPIGVCMADDRTLDPYKD